MEKITKIINDWDPIGFFPMAPKDEYINEIKKIYEYVYSNPDLQVRTLAEAINKIFVETFGADVYGENLEQCILVAEKILESVPDYLKSTQKMLKEAFPNGINQECYWALIYLLYDYMADENLALVMSSIIDKPLGVITNDIYKIHTLELPEKVISEVKCRLNECGFEKWKAEN